MSNSIPSSAPRQSRIPTYSGFFEIFIKQQGTETRIPKIVYFNHERWCFYDAKLGDNESDFRGPHSALTVIGHVNNGTLSFPWQPYEYIESLYPVRSDTSVTVDATRRALDIALSAQKPIWMAPTTSPDYFPPTGQEPADVFRK